MRPDALGLALGGLGVMRSDACERLSCGRSLETNPNHLRQGCFGQSRIGSAERWRGRAAFRPAFAAALAVHRGSISPKKITDPTDTRAMPGDERPEGTRLTPTKGAAERTPLVPRVVPGGALRPGA